MKRLTFSLDQERMDRFFCATFVLTVERRSDGHLLYWSWVVKMSPVERGHPDFDPLISFEVMSRLPGRPGRRECFHKIRQRLEKYRRWIDRLRESVK